MRCPEPCPRRMLAVLTMLILVPLAPVRAQVAGPIEIGPSWASADAARSRATLDTIIVNHGDLADRLIRVECPASGQVSLNNVTRHADVMGPNPAQVNEGTAQRGYQDGLDLPPQTQAGASPVTATLTLADAKQPLTDGAPVPCALYFAHAGERIVLFTIGQQPHATAEP